MNALTVVRKFTAVAGLLGVICGLPVASDAGWKDFLKVKRAERQTVSENIWQPMVIF